MPQMILRNFTNGRGQLWCYNRDTRKCFETSPINVHVVKDLYSRLHQNGTRDASAERWFAAELESPVAPVIRKARECARSGQEFVLTDEEKRSWLRFMRIQCARTQIMFKVMQDDRYFDLAVRMSEAQGLRPTPQLQQLLNDKGIRDGITREAWTKHLTDGHFDHEESMRILDSKGVGLMVIQKLNKSFVIGDNPVARVPSRADSVKVGYPGVYDAYPVAHDVAIFWGRSERDPRRVVIGENEHIRAINELVLRQSTAIAGRSEALVRSLSTSKAARGPRS